MAVYDNFLKNLERKELAESTKAQYTRQLENYFKGKGIDSDALIQNLKDSDDLILSVQNLIDDYRAFYGKTTGRTFRMHLSAMKEFIRANRINVDWKAIVVPQAKPVRERSTPTKEEILKLLDVCGIREKTAVLIMASSGVRITGLVSLRTEDIDFETGLMKVTPKTSASDVKYRTLMSREALDTLKEYLEIQGRREWVFEGFNGDHIDRSQIWRTLNDAMKTAGLIKKEGTNHNGGYRLTPHSFRRFFKGQAVEAKADRDLVEVLLGHTGKNVGTIYLTAPDEQLVRLYREQIEASVMIRDYKELKLRFQDIDLPVEAWNRIATIIQEQVEDTIKQFYEDREAKKHEAFNRRIREAQERFRSAS